MKALIIANGDLYRPEILRTRIGAGGFDLVIGVDGGANRARTLGFSVDAVVGDLDSLMSAGRQDFKSAKFITYPTEKDETDLELALEYAKEKGADHAVVICATGGRIDSTVCNTLILAGKTSKTFKVEMWHANQTAWIIRPPGDDIKGKAGDTLSLIPLSGNASGVTTSGLKYFLNGESLLFGKGRGMSNVLENSSPHVSLSEGLLLAIHTSHPATQYAKTMNVAVQVLPLVEDPYPVVDKAIQAIQASGVKYEVGPLETTLEGDDLDQLLETSKAAHRACFEAGAGKVVTIIKIAESTQGTTIEDKVAKYRKANP